MAGSRWRNWREVGLLEASELKHSDLLNELHPPVSPLAGRGAGRVYAHDIRLPKAALAGCSIVGRDIEVEGANPSGSAGGSCEPRSVSSNCSSLSEREPDKLLLASGRARSVQSRICRQPGGLARLPHERQKQVAAVASVGTGLGQFCASTSMDIVEPTLDEAKGTATSTEDAKGTATSTEDVKGTATSTEDVKGTATSTEDAKDTATSTEDVKGTATSTEDVKGTATSTEDVKGPATSADEATGMDSRTEQKWEADGRTIYLNNLPSNLTQMELASLLEGYGTVQNLLLQPSDSLDCISARVRMDNSSACEWIISCLDGASLDSTLDTTIECGFLQRH